mmetsp:Transcript_6408/g.22559  ORF Transcript_6408/g.22559 Transcript_6408/m.22559 type:complete len:210 (+) Transcript_6408:1985-2614(+)
MTTLLPPMSAMESESLRFIPPDSAHACALDFSERPTLRSASSASPRTSRALTPLKVAKSSRCSRTVSASKRTSCCGHTPTCSLASDNDSATLTPSTSASPPVGGSSPVSMPMVVLLPAPLCPSIAVTCPSYMASERRSTATRGVPSAVGNTLCRPFSSTHRPSASCARSAALTGSSTGSSPASRGSPAPFVPPPPPPPPPVRLPRRGTQ